MARERLSTVLDNFSTGLNVVDSPHDIQDSDLVIANNVIFRPSGEAESIDGLLKIGNSIRVNSILATKQLGGKKFNNTIYIMASNGVEARLVYKGSKSGLTTTFADAGGGQVTVTSASHTINDGDIITISGTTNYNGTFTVTNVTANTFEITAVFNGDDATGAWNGVFWLEASSVDFDPQAKVSFEAYNNKLWFVNGLTTNSNVLHFLDTSNTLTGIGTSSGLEAGINRIVLHLERIWITRSNRCFVSRQYPTGNLQDWDSSRAYSGSNTSGLIQIDDNPNDSIKNLISYFGQLILFREFSIHVVTGKVILDSTIEKSFNSRGVLADFSLAKSDFSIYFLSREGVKQFKGITTQDQTTQFDSISSIGIDRKIRTLIEDFPEQDEAIGYAFKDKYYLSDADSLMYVFDEITGGWSKWDNGAAELFIEDGDSLFCGKGDSYYEVNANTSSDLDSEIRTKDYNLGTDDAYKLFEKVIATVKALASEMTVTLKWYLDGASEPSGSLTITTPGARVQWDSGFKWDSGIKWDSGNIGFNREKKRKLKSGVTIAFGLEASGTNRFSLSALELKFEKLRREA